MIENSLNCHLMGQKIHSFSRFTKTVIQCHDTEIPRDSSVYSVVLCLISQSLFFVFLASALAHNSLLIYDTLILKYTPSIYRYIRFGRMNVLDLEIVSCNVHVDVNMHAMCVGCGRVVYTISTKRCSVFRIYYYFFCGPHAHPHGEQDDRETQTHTQRYTQAPPQSHMCQSFISFQLNFQMNQIKSKAFHFASHGSVYSRFTAKYNRQF